MPERRVEHERHLRIERLQAAAQHVQRELRAGDVGHREVEETLARLQPRAPGRARVGAAKSASCVSLSAPTAWPDCFRSPSASCTRLEALERVGEADRQRRVDRGDAVAERAALVLGAHRHRHHRLELDALGIAAAAAAGASRSAPATTVSTTSLTVPPSAPLIALKRSRSARPRRSAGAGRCGVLSGLGGAPPMPGRRHRRESRGARRPAPAAAAGARSARTAPRARSSGARRARLIASANSWRRSARARVPRRAGSAPAGRARGRTARS